MSRRPPLNPGTTRRFGTRAVDPPSPPGQPGVPVAPVLDPSTTYAFDDAAEFAAASQDMVGAGYVYTRWANPTVDAFEAAVANLEGAAAAEAFATGMAAISTTILALCRAGDRIVAARQLYGGTFSLFAHLLPRFGIDASFVDVGDHDGIARALDGAKLLYCETIGNPRVEVADLPALARSAHAAGVPMVVDNTFASPVLCRPLEHGASVVVHSATKFIGGHNDLMGGIVCADEETIGRIAHVARDLGPTMSPFNAWLALRGLATIHLRVPRSCESAQRIAQMLARHPAIASVDHPGGELVERLLGGMGGGVVGFDVAGGRDHAARACERLRLIRSAASLGGTHSLIVHAASVTHTQLSADELAAVGISEGFCRLAVGLEDAEDLMEDLEQALAGAGA